MFAAEQISLLLDFGLVVLIWMVQLIIYPSFTYHTNENLQRWHPIYTPRITVIVLPLMVGQAGFSLYFLWMEQSFFSTTYAILISSIWMITFFKAVPLHQKIDREQNKLFYARSLVRINWSRTLLWSGVFLFHLVVFTLEP